MIVFFFAKFEMNQIKLKLNSNIPYNTIKTYKKGSIIEIEADEYGTPLDRFWRRRLKDSTIDNCVEIVKEEFKEKKVNIKRVKDAE